MRHSRTTLAACLLCCCGPTTTSNAGDSQGTTTTAGAPTATSAAQASGPITTTTSDSGSESSSDGSSPKLDVPGPRPQPDPCGPVEDLDPTDCYPPDTEYSPQGPSWPLQTADGTSCALVCIYNQCVTDTCFDVVEEIRVVHDGPRVIMAQPDTELLETVGNNGEPMLLAEGWDGEIRLHVSHPVDTDTYAVWATNEATQQIAWGPIEMQWHQP